MDNAEKQNYMALITEGKCTCIVYKDGKAHAFSDPGVKTLFSLLKTDKELLEGSYVFDKIVGKGAAALMITGNVAQVWGEYMSEAALGLLESTEIIHEYRHLIPFIENRDRTGICPIEKICLPCSDAAECYDNIEKFLSNKPKLNQ